MGQIFNLGVVNWNLVADVSNFAGGMDFLPKNFVIRVDIFD